MHNYTLAWNVFILLYDNRCTAVLCIMHMQTLCCFLWLSYSCDFNGSKQLHSSITYTIVLMCIFIATNVHVQRKDAENLHGVYSKPWAFWPSLQV